MPDNVVEHGTEYFTCVYERSFEPSPDLNTNLIRTQKAVSGEGQKSMYGKRTNVSHARKNEKKPRVPSFTCFGTVRPVKLVPNVQLFLFFIFVFQFQNFRFSLVCMKSILCLQQILDECA